MEMLSRAIRGLLRAPRFSLSVWLTLTLGLSVSLSMFALVWHMLYRALPAPNAEQLYVLQAGRIGAANRDALSGLEAFEMAPMLPNSMSVGSYFWNGTEFIGGEKPKTVTTISAQPELFASLQVGAALGRALVKADEGKDHVVLSNAAWRELFQADPQIVGKVFKERGGDQLIVGVMPASFESLMPSVTYYKSIDPAAMRETSAVFNNARFYESLVRIPEGQLELFHAAAKAAEVRLAAQAGATPATWQYHTTPLRDFVLGNVRAPLQALLGLGFLILLITLANAAHLVAARAAQRVPQFAVAAALGASRIEQALQQLIEAVLLTVSAAISAVALFYLLSKAVDLSVIRLPFLQDFGLSPSLLVASLITVVLTSSALFIIPMRLSRLDHQQSMRVRGVQTLSSVHRLLTVPAIACGLVAIATGFLYLQSSSQLRTQALGLNIEQTIAAQFWLPGEADPENQLLWVNQAEKVMAHAAQSKAFDGIGLSNRVPFNLVGDYRVSVSNAEQKATEARLNALAGDAMSVLGYQRISGRDLLPVQGALPVAMVNQSFLQSYFGDQDLTQHLGKTVSLPPYGAGEMKSFEIVGVLNDARTINPALKPVPEIFVPLAQYPMNSLQLIAKGTAAKSRLRELEQIITQALPGQGVYRTYAVQDELNGLSAPQRFFTRFSTLFAVIALVLAMVGIYALMRFDLSVRKQEFALRSAIGASTVNQFQAAARKSMLSMGLGLAFGGLGFFWIAGFLQPQIFGVLNPTLAAGAALILMLLGACFAIGLATRQAARLSIARMLVD
jgi:putative ABC transport system permease protein